MNGRISLSVANQIPPQSETAPPVLLSQTPESVRPSREDEAASMSPVTALLAGTAVLPAPSSSRRAPVRQHQHARHYSVGFPSLLVVECSSRPQKKGTKHHMKTRPMKMQPWDIKCLPTQYPPLPPDWTLVASGTTAPATPILEVAVAAAPTAAD